MEGKQILQEYSAGVCFRMTNGDNAGWIWSSVELAGSDSSWVCLWGMLQNDRIRPYVKYCRNASHFRMRLFEASQNMIKDFEKSPTCHSEVRFGGRRRKNLYGFLPLKSLEESIRTSSSDGAFELFRVYCSRFFRGIPLRQASE
jgi:hypothetical protein